MKAVLDTSVLVADPTVTHQRADRFAVRRYARDALRNAGSTGVSRTFGPDWRFVANGQSYFVELTTKSQVAVKYAKGLEYAESMVVTYRWPGFIFFRLAAMTLLVPGPELRWGTVVEQRPADAVVWEFRDRVVEGVTFRGIRDGEEWLSFQRATFVDCTFEGCALQWDFGTHHERQDEAADLVRCRIRGCDLRQFSLSYGRIEGCTFEGCRWDRHHLRNVDLVDNVFLGVVESLTLWGRDVPIVEGLLRPRPRPNEIRGNDFRRADLRGLALRAEVPVRDQLWPESPSCAVVDRVPERVAAILERTRGSDDPVDKELHFEAQGWHFWNVPGAEQSQLWLRWDDPSMPDASNRFHRALAETDRPAPTTSGW